jgi:hypothetical protein
MPIFLLRHFFYMLLQFSDVYTNKICTNQEQNLLDQEIESFNELFLIPGYNFSL